MQGGFGLEVQITVAAVLTAIANIQDGSELPEFEKFLTDMTPMNATNGRAVWVDSGKRKIKAFKVVLGWDKAEATHAAILAAFDSTTPVQMAVIAPGGGETITFDAHVQNVGRVTKAEGGYTCDVTIQPTGAETIS